MSGCKCSALIKAFVGENNTWSTCPSGVILSSLSSVEPEQPFFTLFGLSFREQNKGIEWVNKRKCNSFSCLLRTKKDLFTLYLSKCHTGEKVLPTTRNSPELMLCSALVWQALFALYMCPRIILYLYNRIYCPWRQDMVFEQPTGTLCWLLVCTFIVTL